jgi:dihydroxyacetone kinase DhaKLM complex PTS-EIIA-like component DhaM
MVALVLVAHSPELLRGLRAMIAQAAGAVPVQTAGGTALGALGTNAPAIQAAVRAAISASGRDGVLVMIDLGSAALAVEVALEGLTPAQRSLVELSEGPIVEGSILAAVESASGASLAAVRAAADRAATARKRPGA